MKLGRYLRKLTLQRPNRQVRIQRGQAVCCYWK